MADLASNLFLRELAKADFDKQHRRSEEERLRQEESGQGEAYARMAEQAEDAREKQFRRQLDVAKLFGEQAARLGKEKPQFAQGAVEEQSQLGYGQGQVAKQEELTKQERAAALQKVQQLERERQEGAVQTRQSLLEAQRQKGQMESLRAQGKLVGSGGGTGSKPTKLGVVGTAQQTKSFQAADEATKKLDEIEAIAVGPDGKPDYSQFLTVQRQGHKKLLSEKERLGQTLDPREQMRLEKGADFSAAVGYLKSKEFHDMLGAAQTAIEMRNLSKAIVSEDVSPTEFAQILKRMKIKAQRASTAAKLALEQGIPPGSPEYAAAIDAAASDAALQGAADSPTDNAAITQERDALLQKAGFQRPQQAMALSQDKYDASLELAVRQGKLTPAERARLLRLRPDELSTFESARGVVNYAAGKILPEWLGGDSGQQKSRIPFNPLD